MPITSAEPLPDRVEEPRALEEVLPERARPGAGRAAGLRLPRLLAEDRRQHLRAPRLAGPEQDPRPVPAEEAPEGHQRLGLGRPHRLPRPGPEGVRDRIKKNKVEMQVRSFPDAKLFQIFLKDPDDVTIELNFLGEAVDLRKFQGKGTFDPRPQGRPTQDPLVRGVVFLGDRKLELRSFPDPTPGPGEVVIEMKASGMCGCDLKFYRRRRASAEGARPGRRCRAVHRRPRALRRGRRARRRASRSARRRSASA